MRACGRPWRGRRGLVLAPVKRAATATATMRPPPASVSDPSRIHAHRHAPKSGPRCEQVVRTELKPRTVPDGEEILGVLLDAIGVGSPYAWQREAFRRVCASDPSSQIKHVVSRRALVDDSGTSATILAGPW